jgi:SAM-dependent methyltransferase
MPLLDKLRQRCRQPEIMDQPDLDRARHFRALRGLERINFWSNSAGILWPALEHLARLTSPRPLRVLDVASGGGDVATGIWHRARRRGLALAIDGCDLSPDAVLYARERAARVGADVGFFTHDALAGPLPDGYHVHFCSLFLHHLDDDQAVDLLRRMSRSAARLVLINDLVRSPTGLLLAHVAVRLLTTSPVVHVDGPRSVEAAFTLGEARSLAERAGLHGARVGRRWPCRFLLQWSRP